MKKDKYKIQIGDVMFEASKMYHKVIQHVIRDIYFEQYISGYKTVVVRNHIWARRANMQAMYVHGTIAQKKQKRRLRSADTG